MTSTPPAGAARSTRGPSAAPSFLARALLFAAALALLAALGDGALARLSSWTSVPPRSVLGDGGALDDAPSSASPSGAASSGATAALDASLATAPPPPPPARDAPITVTDHDAAQTIDLNAATAEELQHLPRVGPKRAHAILELRARLGRFRRVEELLRVRGIGRTTLAKLRSYVRVDAPRDGGVG